MGLILFGSFTDKATQTPDLFTPFLLEFISSPEPKDHGWGNSLPGTPASSNIFSETTGPIKLKFHMETSQDAETKVCLNGPGQMTKMAATPIMVKTIKKTSSPEPEGRWPWDLICSIGDVRPTKFVQIMILGWPWPT